MRNFKFILIGDYGRGNIGDEAILDGILSKISSTFQDPLIVVMTENHEQVKKKLNVATTSSSMLSLDTLKHIKSADLIILGGGGLLQDNHSIINLPYWLSKVVLGKVFGKKVILMGISAGPIDTFLGKIITRFCLKLADCIMVRDEKSKRLLRSIGVKCQIYQSIDGALWLTPPATDRASSTIEAPAIAICPAYWFYSTPTTIGYFFPVRYRKKFGLLPKGSNNKRDSLNQKIAQLCDSMIERYQTNIYLIPMWPLKDHQVITAIYHYIRNKKNVFWIKEEITPLTLISIFRRMELVIGMRLHSLILATIANTPFFALSYSDKVKAYVEYLGLRDHCVDLDNFNVMEVLCLVEKLWGAKTESRKQIASKYRLQLQLHGHLLPVQELLCWDAE